MARQMDNARFWRNRADEVLALVDQMTDPQCKKLLLGVAHAYAELARHAEAREARRRRD